SGERLGCIFCLVLLRCREFRFIVFPGTAVGDGVETVRVCRARTTDRFEPRGLVLGPSRSGHRDEDARDGASRDHGVSAALDEVVVVMHRAARGRRQEPGGQAAHHPDCQQSLHNHLPLLPPCCPDSGCTTCIGCADLFKKSRCGGSLSFRCPGNLGCLVSIPPQSSSPFPRSAPTPLPAARRSSSTAPSNGWGRRPAAHASCNWWPASTGWH